MYNTAALMTQLRMRQQPPGAPAGAVPMNGQAPGFGFAQGMMDRLNAQKKAMNPELPYFQEDRDRLGGMIDGKSAFAGGEWDSLIKQLQDQAAGKGPSLAEQTYRSAQQDTTGALSSMARGSASPAAARQAMIQRGRVGQGMAAGVATARTQEQLGAQGALTQALGSRDQLNQQAFLDILGAQLGLSRAQMEALAGNADRKQSGKNADKAASAAKWSAISGAAGGLGKLGG